MNPHRPRKRRGPGLTKRRAQLIHAERRAFMRLGITVGPGENAAIVKQIQDGRATFLRRSSHRVTVWQVEIGGVPMRAVYDKKRHVIVTVLPLDGWGAE